MTLAEELEELNYLASNGQHGPVSPIIYRDTQLGELVSICEAHNLEQASEFIKDVIRRRKNGRT